MRHVLFAQPLRDLPNVLLTEKDVLGGKQACFQRIYDISCMYIMREKKNPSLRHSPASESKDTSCSPRNRTACSVITANPTSMQNKFPQSRTLL